MVTDNFDGVDDGTGLTATATALATINIEMPEEKKEDNSLQTILSKAETVDATSSLSAGDKAALEQVDTHSHTATSFPVSSPPQLKVVDAGDDSDVVSEGAGPTLSEADEAPLPPTTSIVVSQEEKDMEQDDGGQHDQQQEQQQQSQHQQPEDIRPPPPTEPPPPPPPPTPPADNTTPEKTDDAEGHDEIVVTNRECELLTEPTSINSSLSPNDGPQLAIHHTTLMCASCSMYSVESPQPSIILSESCLCRICIMCFSNAIAANRIRRKKKKRSMMLNCPACDTEFITWDVEITSSWASTNVASSDAVGNTTIAKQSFTIGTTVSENVAEISGEISTTTTTGGSGGKAMMAGKQYIYDDYDDFDEDAKVTTNSSEIKVQKSSDTKKKKNKLWSDVTVSPPPKEKNNSAIMSEETFIPGLTTIDQTSSASGTTPKTADSGGRGFFKNLLEYHFSSGGGRGQREGDEEKRRLKAQLISQELTGSSNDL